MNINKNPTDNDLRRIITPVGTRTQNPQFLSLVSTSVANLPSTRIHQLATDFVFNSTLILPFPVSFSTYSIDAIHSCYLTIFTGLIRTQQFRVLYFTDLHLTDHQSVLGTNPSTKLLNMFV